MPKPTSVLYRDGEGAAGLSVRAHVVSLALSFSEKPLRPAEHRDNVVKKITAAKFAEAQSSRVSGSQGQ
jgi:hypothetical protein